MASVRARCCRGFIAGLVSASLSFSDAAAGTPPPPGMVPDTELAQWLTSRQFAEVARYYELNSSRPEEQAPLRMVLFCAAYSYLAEFDKALACLDRFQGILDAHPGPVRTGTITVSYLAKPYYMRAELNIALGNFAEAARVAQRGLDIVAATPPHAQREFDLMATLQELGLAHGFLGQTAEARHDADAMARAVTLDSDLRRAVLGPALRLGRARIYAAIGDYPAAAKELQRPDGRLDSWVRNFVDQAYLALDIDFILARALLAGGQWDAAQRAYDDLLARPQLAGSGNILWAVHEDMGRLALRRQHRDEAIGHFRQAIDVIEQQRSGINTEANRIGFVGNKQGVYATLVTTLVAAGRQSEAFEIAERAKARALVDLLATRRSFAAPSDDATAVQAVLQDIEKLDRWSAVPASHDAEAVDRHRRDVATARQRLVAVAPDVAALVTVVPPSAAEIRRHLGSDEALVEYYQDGPVLYGFVVTADAVTVVPLDGRDLAGAVTGFRQNIENQAAEATQADGRALYGRLIAPLDGVLAGKSRLTIVPHGPLHYLPFPALPGRDGFLVEKHELRFLPSASILDLLARRRPPAPQPLLVLGDPDLGNPTYDLPGAEAEAWAIAALQPGAVVFLHDKATKALIRETGADYRLLHFASHGQFRPDDPLGSRLLLAGKSLADGQLTAAELYDMRLNADLVTLSACETGLSKVEQGDDVIGLTRGFLFAGARSIVASLWEVSDEATEHLMVAFYRAMPGQRKSAALRQAQVETMKLYPDPLFWAAFQVTGAAE